MVSLLGTSWDELRKKLFTEEERQELDYKVRLVGALIEARRSREMTQQKLGEEVGVRQPFIANIENGRKDPSFSICRTSSREAHFTSATSPS